MPFRPSLRAVLTCLRPGPGGRDRAADGQERAAAAALYGRTGRVVVAPQREPSKREAA